MIKKTKSEKLFKFAFILSIFVFIGSVGLKFYFCNSVTVKNEEFEQAFLKKKDIEEDIGRLQTENSSLSSISYIEKRSSELGFVEMSERIVLLDLDAPEQVALLN